MQQLFRKNGRRRFHWHFFFFWECFSIFFLGNIFIISQELLQLKFCKEFQHNVPRSPPNFTQEIHSELRNFFDNSYKSFFKYEFWEFFRNFFENNMKILSCNFFQNYSVFQELLQKILPEFHGKLLLEFLGIFFLKLLRRSLLGLPRKLKLEFARIFFKLSQKLVFFLRKLLLKMLEKLLTYRNSSRNIPKIFSSSSFKKYFIF